METINSKGVLTKDEKLQKFIKHLLAGRHILSQGRYFVMNENYELAILSVDEEGKPVLNGKCYGVDFTLGAIAMTASAVSDEDYFTLDAENVLNTTKEEV